MCPLKHLWMLPLFQYWNTDIYDVLCFIIKKWSINKTIMIPRQQVCFLWDIEAVLVDDFIVVQKEMPDFIVVMFVSVWSLSLSLCGFVLSEWIEEHSSAGAAIGSYVPSHLETYRDPQSCPSAPQAPGPKRETLTFITIHMHVMDPTWLNRFLLTFNCIIE